MLARVETWVFEIIQKDWTGRWCLHYWHNNTKCKRPIHCVGPWPIDQEVLDIVTEIIGRDLTSCEITDILDLVRIV